VFFFKQKTAYEIPKRDWSSDVCSSDLRQENLRYRIGCQRVISLRSLHGVKIRPSGARPLNTVKIGNGYSNSLQRIT